MSNVWQVDAGYIRESNDVRYEDLVVTNDIKRYLGIDRDTTYFIVAPKGFGKTLFLKYKRLLYQKKYKSENVLLIPYGELVDKHSKTVIFSKEKIDLFKNEENWTNTWLVSIILSIIKNLKMFNQKQNDSINDVSDILNDIEKSNLRLAIKLINDVFKTPFDFLQIILNMSHSDFYTLTNEELIKLNAIMRGKRIPTAIFIDNVDELFLDHIKNHYKIESSSGILSPDIWYNSQIGLIFASRRLASLNGHIKVFASIRKEAVAKLNKQDPMALQISGNMLDIQYSENDIRNIFIKNIKKIRNPKYLAEPKYLNEDPIFSFLGIKILTNTHTKEDETIFRYIYRHTLKRPRDVIYMGERFCENKPTEDDLDTDKPEKETIEFTIKKIVNDAATDIATQYFNEISPHIDFNENNRDKLFSFIDYNILTQKQIKLICAKFNDDKNCQDKNCKKCEKTHVFCNLYKLGLLGVIKKDTYSQSFLTPGKETFAESGILPQSPFYLIHPVLNRLIEVVNSKYDTNERIIVGDDYPWKQLKRKCCFKKNELCTAFEPLQNQSKFLISSHKYKTFTDELISKLKLLNYDVKTWTKNESNTGLIFCDRVCPKIRDSHFIIAEISDFNPNVFFEAGFSIGLGKPVCLIKNNSHPYRMNLLYVQYTNIDYLVKELEEFFENQQDNNKFYSKQKTFNDIDNFDYPERRKKSNKVHILSFNQNIDLIEKLKNYGYIIEAPNHLDQNFTNVDVLRELIDAKAVLVNLMGRQNEINQNQINDSKLMFLAGICAAQGVPVKIFQSNKDVYSDVFEISLFTNSVDELTNYVNSLPLDDSVF